MERYNYGNETLLAQDQFFMYDSDNELPGIEYINQLDEVSLFVDGIKSCLIDLCLEDIPEEASKLVTLLTKCCAEAGVHISRQTLTNWIISGVPSTSKTGRDNVYQLCFALKMDADKAGEFFLKAYLERPFNYKDLHEAIYFFCLNTKKGYADAVRLIQQIEETPVSDDPNAISVTEAIGVEIRKIKDEDDFIHFIANNRSGFVVQNKTATEKINELIEKAMPIAELEYKKTHSHEKPIKVEKIDTLLNVIYDYSARQISEKTKVFKESISNSAFPQMIKRNFPQRQQFENIRKHNASYDVIRKALIMLNFYHFFADAVLKDVETGDLFDEFVEETDVLLNECGYVQLYWRNPYDWFIGYCASSDDPLAMLRDLIDEYYLSRLDMNTE